jgi:hypothetical protein
MGFLFYALAMLWAGTTIDHSKDVPLPTWAAAIVNVVFAIELLIGLTFLFGCFYMLAGGFTRRPKP